MEDRRLMIIIMGQVTMHIMPIISIKGLVKDPGFLKEDLEEMETIIMRKTRLI